MRVEVFAVIKIMFALESVVPRLYTRFDAQSDAAVARAKLVGG
jgi:hypothetical protein